MRAPTQYVPDVVAPSRVLVAVLDKVEELAVHVVVDGVGYGVRQLKCRFEYTVERLPGKGICANKDVDGLCH
jgi:hypothetical protein